MGGPLSHSSDPLADCFVEWKGSALRDILNSIKNSIEAMSVPVTPSSPFLHATQSGLMAKLYPLSLIFWDEVLRMFKFEVIDPIAKHYRSIIKFSPRDKAILYVQKDHTFPSFFRVQLHQIIPFQRPTKPHQINPLQRPTKPPLGLPVGKIPR